MKPKALFHKWGGRITAIVAVGHSTQRGTLAEWFYVCHVEWSDKSGDPAKEVRVGPWALCTDTPEGEAEYRVASDALMAYLNDHGEWREHSVRGSIWVPKHRSGRRELAFVTPPAPASVVEVRS